MGGSRRANSPARSGVTKRGLLGYNTKPMASVPVVMNQFAASPYESWQVLAWAGALVLTVFVLLVSLGARALLLRNRITHD